MRTFRSRFGKEAQEKALPGLSESDLAQLKSDIRLVFFDFGFAGVDRVLRQAEKEKGLRRGTLQYLAERLGREETGNEHL